MKYDVFMVGFDEDNIVQNWKRLTQLCARARRLDGVVGIRNAYDLASQNSRTAHFFVVDADSWVLDGTVFNAISEGSIASDAVLVWRALNPINGLCYGHGGIKLLPKCGFESLDGSPDITMGISRNYRAVSPVASEHRFNTSALFSWRTAFRECAKLSAMERSASNQRNLKRLETWCMNADTKAKFAHACCHGARAGRAYGSAHSERQEEICKINDYEWLRERFEHEYDK